jgi:hypothetical protein
MPEETVTDLKSFLHESVNLLDQIVTEWSDLLFHDEYREPLRAAWAELKPNAEQDIERFNPRKSDTAEHLARAGLTGAQLDLKLKGFSAALNKFRVVGTVKWLKKVLEWINKILKSLIGVIPGADAIDEIKGVIEELLDDDE